MVRESGPSKTKIKESKSLLFVWICRQIHMPSSFADHENKISRYRSLAVIDNKANAVLRIPSGSSE